MGDTYSIGFGLLRGIKKRVPLAIHQSKHTAILDSLMAGTVQKGSIKLWRSKRGRWYVLLSVSMEVPDAKDTQGWIGIDRGQNVIAVGSTPAGMPKFWRFAQIRQVRKHRSFACFEVTSKQQLQRALVSGEGCKKQKRQGLLNVWNRKSAG